VELRASELAMILDGIDMSKVKRVPRHERSEGTNKITPKELVRDLCSGPLTSNK
jgi:hypothetical protein